MIALIHEPGLRIAVFFAIVAIVSACMMVRVAVDAVRQRRERFEAEVVRAAESRALRKLDSDDPVDVLLPTLSPIYVLRITGAVVGWAILAAFGGFSAIQMFQTTNYTRRANGFMAQHNYEEAVNMFRLAMDYDKRARDLDTEYEKALAQRDLNAGPASALRLETQVHPSDVGAHLELGNSLMARHDIAGAIVEYSRAADLMPYNSAAHNNLSNAYLADHQLSKAAEEMQKAVDIDPKFPAFHYNLANILARQNDLTKAVSEYKKSIELDPKLAPAYYDLSQILYAHGDHEQGVFMLDNFLQLTHGQPQYAQITNLARKQLAGWRAAH